jgi:hypothetical protein
MISWNQETLPVTSGLFSLMVGTGSLNLGSIISYP